MAAASDPATQLVQLGDAEPVGITDHHHRGVGHVDTDLDHGGGDQHVGLAGGEPAHHGVLLLGRELAVQQLHPDPGQPAAGQLGVEVLGGDRRLQLLTADLLAALRVTSAG